MAVDFEALKTAVKHSGSSDDKRQFEGNLQIRYNMKTSSTAESVESRVPKEDKQRLESGNCIIEVQSGELTNAGFMET